LVKNQNERNEETIETGELKIEWHITFKQAEQQFSFAIKTFCIYIRSFFNNHDKYLQAK
jgi:hypothetical protein